MQDMFKDFRRIGAMDPQRDRGMFKYFNVGVGAGGVEVEKGILAGQEIVQRSARAIDIGGFSDAAEVSNMVGRNVADRA